MARKIKSEKIIAELRRKVKIARLQNTVRDLESDGLPKEKYLTKEPVSYKASKKTAEIQVLENSESIKFIKKDIYKTLSLTTIIISLEIFLYWFFEKGGEKIFKSLLSIKLS